ncbi:MAG: hypothetical protein KF802_01525 [Bdellovibrionaceae bacterium]|nr:hypothetical protein [Pseudobdellovibrionaceae bacterium]MBX3034869.1 hypothetical protein [Pseudobdellovibrionaceae bacterium]
MRSRWLSILLIPILLSAFRPARAEPGTSLAGFLKACAWGTVIGAGVGTITLAFEDRPSEHTVNIARGASLGLYAGIGAGLMQLNPPEAPVPNTDNLWGVAPRWDASGLRGVDVIGVISRF